MSWHDIQKNMHSPLLAASLGYRMQSEIAILSTLHEWLNGFEWLLMDKDDFGPSKCYV